MIILDTLLTQYEGCAESEKIEVESIFFDHLAQLSHNVRDKELYTHYYEKFFNMQKKYDK